MATVDQSDNNNLRLLSNFLFCFFFAQTTMGAVKGYLDRTTNDAGYVYVEGWACQENLNQSINVHMYVNGTAGGGGTMIASALANRNNEQAVNTACGTSGSKHRYQFKISKQTMLQYRNKPIYVYGIKANSSATNQLLTKSGTINVQNFSDQSVIGYNGAVSETATQVIFTGWTCQSNVAKELSVHIYTGGPAGQGGQFLVAGSTTVNHEQAVTDRCGATGVRHRFRIAVNKSSITAHRGRTIYAHGISTIPGYSNLALLNGGRYSVPNFIRKMNLSEVPKTNGDTIIPADVEAVINGNYSTGLLNVIGKLSCPLTGNYNLSVTGVLVSGEINCGTYDNPVTGKIRFKIRGHRTLSMTMDHMGNTMTHSMGKKAFAVVSGGRVNMYGHRGKSYWVRLAGNATPLADIINVNAGVGWQVGDSIAIAPSDYDYLQAEEFTITQRISSTSYKIHRRPSFTHYGSDKTYTQGSRSWTLRSAAEVGNMTRNIVIETEEDMRSTSLPEDDRYIGAHMMVMPGGFAYIDSVEFANMGQAGEMARYPFHWHLAGNVNGQFIRNSSIHHSFQRCVTVHGTNWATVQNNFCYDHRGHGIFLEDGNEVFNVIDKNLVMKSMRPYSGRSLLESDSTVRANGVATTGTQHRRFSPPAAYWISNPKNTIKNNVAAGSQGTGFWMSFENKELCNRDECSNPSTSTTTQFDNNISKASTVGMTWDGARVNRQVANPNNPDNDFEIDSVLYSPPNIPTFVGNQVMKSKLVGLYTRSKTSNFDQTVTADNGWHHFHAYNQRIRNSVMIGEGPYQTDAGRVSISSSADSQGHYGIVLYDGPFELQNVHFAHFSTTTRTIASTSGPAKNITATPIGLIGGADKFTNRTSGLSFSPEPLMRIDMHGRDLGWKDSHVSQSLLDIDGTLTGETNAMVVVDDAFNRTTSCVRDGATGSAICPAENYKIGTLLIHDMRPGGNTNYFFFNTIRNGSVESFPNGVPTAGNHHSKVNMIVGGGNSYVIDFENQGGHLRRLMYHTERAGERSPAFTIRGLTDTCSVEGATQVSSPSAVNSSSGSSFYRNGRELTVKLVPNSQDNKFTGTIRSYKTMNRLLCN